MIYKDTYDLTLSINVARLIQTQIETGVQREVQKNKTARMRAVSSCLSVGIKYVQQYHLDSIAN